MPSFGEESEVKSLWESHADSWSKRSKNMWESGSRKSIVPFIEQQIPEGKHILDIGCGDGYGTYKLHQAGFRVTGMDFSSEMIKHANERVAAEEITFLQGNITKMPFAGQSFDGIMAINVLEWTDIPAVAVRELQRVVKTEGLLFIGILGPTAGPRSNSYSRLYGDKEMCNTMMPWEFEKLAAEHGLACVDSFGVFKNNVNETYFQSLPLQLKQALAFMWIFMLRKTGET